MIQSGILGIILPIAIFADDTGFIVVLISFTTPMLAGLYKYIITLIGPAAGITLRSRIFFVGNLLPVTIGNIIGGAGLVAAVYWAIFLRKGDSK